MAASATSTVRCALRRFTLGNGPLKRGSDRVQFAARLLLLALVLLSLPLALTVGTVVRSDLLASVDQQPERVRTTAVLTADAPVLVGSEPDYRPPTPARWTAPDGTPGEGTVPAQVGSRAGGTVPVWLTPDGKVTTPPLTAEQATQNAVVLGGLAWVGMLIAGSAAHLALCWLLDRQRRRRWAREWAAVEPVWARRVR
ncbi:Rv1733c family protein [Geodermatophilus ruber]|uniref:Transmembrane protein n=1 Tax=Geodermatophilus ruber TaxID=504800 RepID=A0A1I4HNI6_9ACTN|nr:hypothetical protein [Geodermatophilus ruber]SFL43307.1 hypothetical protein SAMN04488085_11135 [Geodermatophilus ruber]